MSVLNQVKKGRKLKPLAMIVHAPHGLGKTKFGEETKDPIFVGPEENGEIDSPVMPRIKSWKQLESQLSALLNEDHEYKTLVIDTMDGLEQVAEREILTGKNAGKSMATAMGGYGKAFEKMANMFLNLRDDYIIPLRESKGMNIIILAHSMKTKHEDPMTNASYDHYETAMHKKVKPIYEDWVSAIFFINYQLYKAENSSGKEYVEGDGSRMVYTEERPSHVAKNRFSLEYDYDFEKDGTFEQIKKGILSHFANTKVKKEEKGEEFNDESEDIKKAIQEIVPKLPADIKPAIEASLGRAKDNVKELNRILTKCKGMIA